MNIAIFRMGYKADTKTHIVLKIFGGQDFFYICSFLYSNEVTLVLEYSNLWLN